MQDQGVAGMVRSGLWLERNSTVEVLNIGRPALSRDDCVMELAGRQLAMHIALRGTWIWLSVASLDSGESPELLCNFGDGPRGWSNLRALVLALERSGIRSLKERPLRLGEGGTPDSYCIDY
jgi:hypothetical protein